jgi:hypothetical protein
MRSLMKINIHKQLEELEFWQSRRSEFDSAKRRRSSPTSVSWTMQAGSKSEMSGKAKNQFCRLFVYIIILFLSPLAACKKCPEKIPPFTVQEFTGREESVGVSLVRRPVYRAKVPAGWVRIDPVGTIQDTKEPNATFLVEEKLKVTIHTFPSNRLEERIPPSAQIARWKRQLGEVETSIEPACHGGFVGLCLEGPTMLAWSMQLDLEHYQTLTFLASSHLEEEHFKQMRADYTIKAAGPEELIESHRNELRFFADSFELIQEIPKRT